MKYIDETELAGKRVFIRADLNVPLAAGEVADDNRIRASLPTIQYALSHGASVVLCSHLGRPKGKVSPEFSLAPVAKRLSSLLKIKVELAPDCIGTKTAALAAALTPGSVLLLENLRFHAEEEANDARFSEQLASLGDVYVNDAFATAHRAHASTVGITHFFDVRVGGLGMKEELEYFKKAFEKPARPFIAIFGGAKVSTKMDAIKNVGSKADAVIVGGAMANTFLAARGYEIGRSLFEPEQVENARTTETFLADLGCELLLPVDVVVASGLESGIPTKIVDAQKIPADQMALDIGPATIESFVEKLQAGATIIWNGPMGAFETKEFSSGTFAIVDAMAKLQSLRIVGGGDTDLALHQRGAFDKMSYVSTAGGAFLKLLEGAELPAVVALQ